MITSAKWIKGNMQSADASSLLRKVFYIKDKIQKATLQICAVGLGVCTINGQNVTEEVLSTPYTKYDKRLIFNEYNVSAFLTKGKNIIVVHLGNGFFCENTKTWNDINAPWHNLPRCSIALMIECESGEKEYILSDDTWETMFGPCVYNHMRQGEWYDARLIDKEFFSVDSEKKYDNAIVTQSPGGKLEKMDMPPIRILESIIPTKIGENIYDFGANISGFAQITVVGESGQEIKLIYDEILNAKEVNKRNVAQFMIKEEKLLQHEDVYVCGGNGREVYAPSFCYHGFRFVTVENAPKDFEIVAKYLYTDLKQIGDFSCNDETLNKIHQASLRSTLSNYVGIPTDCPHREQNGWTGDALMSLDQCLMNFDMVKAYKKWLNDFKDAQRPSGQLPGIIPSAGWGYNWGSGPAWDSALIHIPYKTYLIAGDDSLIKQTWENMHAYMNFMDSMAINDLVDYGLEDWCYPSDCLTGKAIPAIITDTAYYHINCLYMAKMSKLMGENPAPWIEKADRIKKAWRTKFLNNIEYRKNQTLLACAIYQKLVDKEEIPILAKELADLVVSNGYHIICGILGVKYIFSVLSENGYADVLYKAVVNPDYPSYAFWINSGMTTLGETWRPYRSSGNHHMFSEVDNWFYRYVAGIRFTEEGLIISPCFIKEINEVHARHCEICVDIKDKEVKVSVPCQAKIIIKDKESVIEKGEYVFYIE